MDNNKKVYDYFCKIPNDQEGQYFLYILKKYLSSSYKISVRGGNPNKKLLKKDKIPIYSVRQHCPLKYAQELRIYIQGNIEGVNGTIGINEMLYHKKMSKEYFKIKASKRNITNNVNDIQSLLNIIKQEL